MPQKKDDSLLSELFTEYRQMMFKIAFSILRNNADAEDAVQETFLHISNNFERVSEIPVDDRVRYITKIVKNVCYDQIRIKKRRQVCNIEEFEIRTGNSVEDEALSALTVDEIKSALNDLSKRDNDILYLLLFMDYAPKDIAKSLGISERNISMYIIRARKRLIKALRKRGVTNDL